MVSAGDAKLLKNTPRPIAKSEKIAPWQTNGANLGGFFAKTFRKLKKLFRKLLTFAFLCDIITKRSNETAYVAD